MRIKMMQNKKEVFLDTHIFLWLVDGDSRLKNKTLDLINDTSEHGKLMLSAISIWEIALLESKNRISLNQSINNWVNDAINLSGVKVLDLSKEVLIESCNLRGNIHSDPADRIIIASSRMYKIPLITYDARIIEYSKNKNNFLKIIGI
jgi:PIN domain nuclease of toxin-antitoxin system